jgi:hypothetical protein
MFQQLATGTAVDAACAARRLQDLLRISPPSFHRLGKMLKEKLRSCLNPTGTPHVAVPQVFVELQLWVVVVGFPPLSPPSSHGLGKMLKAKSRKRLNLTGTPTPCCLRGRRGGLGLHQDATVGGGTERE